MQPRGGRLVHALHGQRQVRHDEDAARLLPRQGRAPHADTGLRPALLPLQLLPHHHSGSHLRAPRGLQVGQEYTGELPWIVLARGGF